MQNDLQQCRIICRVSDYQELCFSHSADIGGGEPYPGLKERKTDMKSPLTTLCYIEKDGKYLMLYRNKKEHDVNEGKWIGIGGHFEEGESPDECLLREVKEETGLELTNYQFRGIVTFISDGWPVEYMCLFTADAFNGHVEDVSHAAKVNSAGLIRPGFQSSIFGKEIKSF